MMASACFVIADNTGGTDAAVSHGSSSSPLSSLSADGYDLETDSNQDYYVYVGSQVSIVCTGDGGGADEFAYNITGVTSGYGLTYDSSYVNPEGAGEGKVAGTLTKAGNISVSYDGWDGDTTFSGSVTIHAIAKPSVTEYTCYLQYSANGGSGAPAQQSYTGTSTSNHAFTISSVTPTKSGYSFLGWATSSSATEPSYHAGDTINVGYKSTRTLYAVWQENVTVTYQVTVHKGNWDSFMMLSDGVQYTDDTHTYTVEAGTVIDIDWYEKEKDVGAGPGYAYVTTYSGSEYNISSSLYGTSLGNNVTVTSDADYYPASEMTSSTTYVYKITIQYDANGGTGAPAKYSNQGSTQTRSVKISTTIPTKEGYTFLGWSESSTAASATYLAGKSYTFSYGTTTLYAVWGSAEITVSGTPDQYGIVGTAWTFRPTVNVTGCTVTVSGASWLNSNGSVISGTPTSPGDYNVTLTFSKTGYTSATKTFTVTVYSALSFESSPTGGAIIYAV